MSLVGTFRNDCGEISTVIVGTHCQACGSTDWYDLDTGDDDDFQGYSRCCNEIVVGACSSHICYHP